MIKMKFPDDVNPQPDAKYYRQSSDAFLCNAREARATQSFPKPNRPGVWLTIAMMVLIGLALYGCSPDESMALTSNDNGAAMACEGMTAVWVSATEVECLKETL